MSNMMSIRSLPNATLLGLLLGDATAASLAGKSLADLFNLRSRPLTIRETGADDRAERILDAAKELLARALSEEMQESEVLSSPDKVRDFLRLRLAERPHEVFMVLLMDVQHRLLADVELFRGTLTQTSVYPREVVKLALSHNAAAVIFAHNHPSGVPEPSQADIHLTNALRQALSLVDVRTIDHIVVGGNASPVSFAERGLL
jgi:DNA repair protein RadC